MQRFFTAVINADHKLSDIDNRNIERKKCGLYRCGSNWEMN